LKAALNTARMSGALLNSHIFFVLETQFSRYRIFNAKQPVLQQMTISF